VQTLQIVYNRLWRGLTSRASHNIKAGGAIDDKSSSDGLPRPKVGPLSGKRSSTTWQR
jgi:hypothetical protein